jgi:hypothetical protein
MDISSLGKTHKPSQPNFSYRRCRRRIWRSLTLIASAACHQVMRLAMVRGITSFTFK